MDFTDYITERTQDFTGREWVFQKISAWLENDGGSRCFLLTGGPGSGKTALAARLVQMSLGEVPAEEFPALGNGGLAYFHFCRALMDTTLNPQRFVENLSMALAERFQPFRVALQQVVERSSNTSIQATVTQNVSSVESGAQVTGVRIQVRIGDMPARSSFDLLIRRPLQMIFADGFNRRIVILVDSLDEALTYAANDHIPDLLSRTADLPPNVRLILTSRPDDQVFSLIRDTPLDLIAGAPPNSEDVRQYAFQRLSMLAEPQRSSFANRLALEANGNFLYARYVLDDLLPQIAQIADLVTLPLPADLQDQYRLFLQRELARNVKDWLKDYAPLFAVLAVARGQGLSLNQLAGITQRAFSETSLLLAACDQYLLGPQPKGPFRIYHQSFRDFLLENQTFPIFPAEAHARIADFFIKQYGKRWSICKEDYALQFTPAHLAEAARLDAEFKAHEFSVQLVRLVTDPGFQRSYLDIFSDPIGLRQNLELALKVASGDQDPEAPGPVLETALALEKYRRETLQPQPIFELARQGKVLPAEKRLALFGMEPHWRSMILLTIAWLAAGTDPAAARPLLEQVRPAISGSPLLGLLLERVEAGINGVDFPAALLPPLPPDPGYGPVREIVNRMGGGDYNPSFLMEFGSELDVQRYEMLMEGDPLAGPEDEGPAYIGEREGPLLVAFAFAHPDEGDQVLREYLAIHALNNYVLYRNRSLWGLLAAVLMHPDQAWVQSILPELAQAAMTGNRLVFSETLEISLSALVGEPDPKQALDARAEKALESSAELMLRKGGPDEKGDAWGSHARRLAFLAEAYSLVFRDSIRSLELLDQALELPRGFAGFRAGLCLTLAESLRICAQDGVLLEQALHAGLEAAHNITDPIFCLRTTARFNAIRSRYWTPPDLALDVEQEVENFIQDTGGPLQSALHIVGDGYTHRKVAIPVSLPLPSLCYSANTLAQLAHIYQQPLAEFRRLNPGCGPDEILPVGTLVNVPDPEFAPLAASRLAAEALVSISLSNSQRAGILQSLIPIAAPDPTVLFNLSGRLILAAGLKDPQTISRWLNLLPGLNGYEMP